MKVKNTTKNTIDPIVIGDSRICLESGEVIDLEQEQAEQIVKEYKGLAFAEKEKNVGKTGKKTKK